ncbi:MAG: hypothetical protein ABIQ75_05005, partial [Flavobacteriales bacterium]
PGNDRGRMQYWKNGAQCLTILISAAAERWSRYRAGRTTRANVHARVLPFIHASQFARLYSAALLAPVEKVS